MQPRGAPSARSARTFWPHALLVVVAALLVSGCSGGSEGPDEPLGRDDLDHAVLDGSEQPREEFRGEAREEPRAEPRGEAPAPDPGADPTLQADPMPPPPDAAPGPDLVAAAIQDAAQRTGVEPGTVEVRLAEPITWPDGSLGCPEPGLIYTQALVPGYRIVVHADGQDLHYHGADGALPAFCADPWTPDSR